MIASVAMSGSTEPAAATARQLNGWKEIAAYLGKSVRSVQRWEVTLGLPVRRIRTPDGVIIYAEPGEIDTWKRTLDAPRALVEEVNGGGDEAIEAEPSSDASETSEARRPVLLDPADSRCNRSIPTRLCRGAGVGRSGHLLP